MSKLSLKKIVCGWRLREIARYGKEKEIHYIEDNLSFKSFSITRVVERHVLCCTFSSLCDASKIYACFWRLAEFETRQIYFVHK